MSQQKYTAVKSTGRLEQMPVADLLRLYAKLTGKPAPEFKQKDALVRACILELAKTNTPPGRRRIKVEKKLEREPPNRKPWGFDPTRLEPTKVRKGTKREKLIAMLRKGATFAEVQSRLGWTYKQAFVQMRHVNTKNGYGFVERNKRLTIFTYEEGPPE
tara:strand:+ start:24269 stop:24745 length:477 start_codon:yes stop_codon:yes gene_type:complete